MTNQVILVPNDRGGIAIIYPAPNCGISIEEIARKDGPAGQPYLIVNADAVPQDNTFFEAFEADFSDPHGYSVGPQAWFIEQYQAEIATLDPATDQARIDQLNRQIAVQQAEMNQ